jgi:hypothetical protein
MECINNNIYNFKVSGLLDAVSEEKIPLDVAIELLKLPSSIDAILFFDKIQELTNQQKIETIKKFNSNNLRNINDLYIIISN